MLCTAAACHAVKGIRGLCFAVLPAILPPSHSFTHKGIRWGAQVIAGATMGRVGLLLVNAPNQGGIQARPCARSCWDVHTTP